MTIHSALLGTVLFFMLHSEPLAIASNSMIGGTAVPASHWISHTVVALIASGAQGESLCTASLVAQDLAITAAHCVTSERAGERLVLGLVFSHKVKNAPADHIRWVDRVEVPTEWNPSSRDLRDTSDVALLHFSGGLPVSYSPSDLLPFDFPLTRGLKVELAGYGISNASRETGSGTLRKVEVTISNPNYSASEVEFDQSHGGGACHGDSGGPAYVVIGGHPYLFGITSRGGGNCNLDVIYTKIAAYSAWFTEATRQIRR